MYESPIEITIKDIVQKIEQERESAIMYKLSQECGITVDAKELIKALNYDRQQYEKGWKDAHGHAHWTSEEIDDDTVYRCSTCHEHFKSMTRYCPYCGSYMNLSRW